MDAPTSPTAGQSFNIDSTSDEHLLSTSLMNDATEETQTTSYDTRSEHKSPVNESEIFATEVVSDPAQTIEEAKTSSIKSTASNIKAQSSHHSPVHSRSASSMKSSASAVASQSSSSHHSSVRSVSIDGKDYETFGGDEDSFDVFKPKVIELCHAIGYGEPDEVERMEGGSFNRILGLKFSSPEERRLVLRLPWEPYNDEQPHDISDQVSVLLYLSQFDLKVPQVLGYDTTTNNAIKIQYVLHTRLPGSNMDEVFYKLSRSEKLDLTGQIAELVVKMTNIKLAGPGRLIGPRTLPAVCHVAPSPLKTIQLGAYRQMGALDDPASARQPLPDLLVEIFQGCANRETESESMQDKYQELQRITHEMVKAGLVRHRDADNVLWHWDFCARNILIHEELLPKLPRELVTNSALSTRSPNGTSKGCKHTFNFAVEEGSGTGHRHSVQVEVEDAAGEACKHSVSVIVEGNNGLEYRHQIEVKGKEKSGPAHSLMIASVEDGVLLDENAKDTTPAQQGQPRKRWVVSGVLDWDNVLSVPLVVANRPQSWLWFNEEERREDWTGDEDEMPHRDLTEDELLIKSHIDQIMTRDSLDYWQDAYGRGVWIRRLTRFAQDGFKETRDWDRYHKLVADWAEYYQNLGFNRIPDVEVLRAEIGSGSGSNSDEKSVDEDDNMSGGAAGDDNDNGDES
jgi:hypothetical protein